LPEAIGFHAHPPSSAFKESLMSENTLGLILLVILVLALVGALPTWRYSRNWGYMPMGGIGLVLVVLLILVLLGRI
jgi:hypothetical protein